MTILEVKYGTVTDVLGKKKTGWFIFENGAVGSVPYPTEEKANSVADDIWSIRGHREPRPRNDSASKTTGR